ncbi:hypothetical protein [Planctomonas psychrotolerans]|uniref:hypothetical protein n=1 Tax=Planctomonas psychrotolerans TaxID=2528712 RepID=UPI001D0D2D5C|nr:hypothetical protein [Planctomonas psychrotolerans]
MTNADEAGVGPELVEALAGDTSGGASDVTTDDVVEQLRIDIQMGHVDADVVDVLEERLKKAGIDMRPEEIDDLAEEIENDASR